VYEPMQKIMQKFQKELDDVLTGQQKEALQKARASGGLAGGTPGAWAPIQKPTGQKPSQPGQPGAKIQQLPGGGIQVIIREDGEEHPAEKKPVATKGPVEKGQVDKGRVEKGESEVKVEKLPGGGIRIIIGERAEGGKGERAEGGKGERAEGAKSQDRQALENALKSLREAQKSQIEGQASAKARMGEKIKHQHELAEKAWQTFQKMEAMGEGQQAQAHELWERLEQLEAELRRTFEPLAGASAVFTGGTAWVVQGAAKPGAPMPGAPLPGTPLPGGEPGKATPRRIVVTPGPHQDGGVEELRNQVRELRREVEEIKDFIRKTIQK